MNETLTIQPTNNQLENVHRDATDLASRTGVDVYSSQPGMARLDSGHERVDAIYNPTEEKDHVGAMLLKPEQNSGSSIKSEQAVSLMSTSVHGEPTGYTVNVDTEAGRYISQQNADGTTTTHVVRPGYSTVKINNPQAVESTASLAAKKINESLDSMPRPTNKAEQVEQPKKQSKISKIFRRR